MITIATLTVALIGASAYRYYATLDAEKADARITSARAALMLSQCWQGLQGAATFDPKTSLDSDLTITNATGPAQPAGFTKLGSYKITLNNINCFATLSWKDLATGLRALNVTVTWGRPNKTDTDLADTDKLFELTTYTLTP